MTERLASLTRVALPGTEAAESLAVGAPRLAGRSRLRHGAGARPGAVDLSTGQVFALASWREPALSSASQAGMVNNLNDGLAWGLFRSCSPPPGCR